MRTRERAQLEVDLAQLIKAKDKYLADFRKAAKVITTKMDKAAADDKAEEVLGSMNQIEIDSVAEVLGAN